MTKELSIEMIKKEIISKFMSKTEIERYLKQGKETIDEIYDVFIYDHDITNGVNSNYIAVEVAEYEESKVSINDTKRYTVSIKIGLEHKENLDKLASVIKDIVSDLYPDRNKYSNIPFYGTDYDFNGHEYKGLNRMITFEIEE